jgi:hypothetical protein
MKMVTSDDPDDVSQPLRRCWRFLGIISFLELEIEVELEDEDEDEFARKPACR